MLPEGQDSVHFIHIRAIIDQWDGTLVIFYADTNDFIERQEEPKEVLSPFYRQCWEIANLSAFSAPMNSSSLFCCSLLTRKSMFTNFLQSSSPFMKLIFQMERPFAPNNIPYQNKWHILWCIVPCMRSLSLSKCWCCDAFWVSFLQ